MKFGLLQFALVIGFSACVNSSDPPGNNYINKVATSTRKTIVIDVRTAEEWFDDGHAACSVNFPLKDLGSNIEKIRPFEKVVVVCRSGYRAGIAKEQLEKAGIKNVENKGAWQNISCDSFKDK